MYFPVFPEAPTMQTFIARTSGSPKRLSRKHPNDNAHHERTRGRSPSVSADLHLVGDLIDVQLSRRSTPSRTAVIRAWLPRRRRARVGFAARNISARAGIMRWFRLVTLLLESGSL